MQDLLEILTQIPDPEIPVINIVELGIVRDAKMISENENAQTIDASASSRRKNLMRGSSSASYSAF